MKILKKIIIALLLWFSLHSFYIIYDGLHDKNQNADVAIVLGNKVNEDGTLSKRLEARLNQSIKLFNNKRILKIIVSGGFGKEGFYEGAEMQKYLIKNIIPEDKIIVDNKGITTEATVINSIKIMDSLKYTSAISVSQYFHQTRTKSLFKKNGFQNIESSSPVYFEWRDFYAIFREFFAFYS